MQYLIAAGIYNSGPDHWQSAWMAESPSFVKLEHKSWTHPERRVWVNDLSTMVDELQEEVVIVAHSLACLMVAHWSCHATEKVRAALLVSVPDPDGPNFPEDATGFGAVPHDPLPFKSLVVSSTNDPYGTHDYMKLMAKAWGSEFVSVGNLGHINAASALGNWPTGKVVLERLVGESVF